MNPDSVNYIIKHSNMTDSLILYAKDFDGAWWQGFIPAFLFGVLSIIVTIWIFFKARKYYLKDKLKEVEDAKCKEEQAKVLEFEKLKNDMKTLDIKIDALETKYEQGIDAIAEKNSIKLDAFEKALGAFSNWFKMELERREKIEVEMKNAIQYFREEVEKTNSAIISKLEEFTKTVSREMNNCELHKKTLIT